MGGKGEGGRCVLECHALIPSGVEGGSVPDVLGFAGHTRHIVIVDSGGCRVRDKFWFYALIMKYLGSLSSDTETLMNQPRVLSVVVYECTLWLLAFHGCWFVIRCCTQPNLT